MANKRLITKPPDDDKRDPHDKFTDFASKIFTVQKAEIDKRETQWRATKRKREAT